MGVYIPSMKLPKEGGIEIMILAEGKAIETGHTVRIDGKDYYTATLGEKEAADAIPVPDHGRLIDADELRKEFKEPMDWLDSEQCVHHVTGIWASIDAAETVIPADREAT